MERPERPRCDADEEKLMAVRDALCLAYRILPPVKGSSDAAKAIMEAIAALDSMF